MIVGKPLDCHQLGRPSIECRASGGSASNRAGRYRPFGMDSVTIHVTTVIPQCGILLNSGSCAGNHGPAVAEVQGEAAELIGVDGIEAVALYLSDYPDAGDVIPEAGGARKLRWAAKGKGKRGGARIIYLYVGITAPHAYTCSADEE